MSDSPPIMAERTVEAAQVFVKNFVDERNWHTSASDILIHMVEELGEVARNVLKMKNYGGRHTSESENNMDEELADVFYLLLKLANEANVDLGSAFEAKMEKNSRRFPPVTNSNEA